MPMNMNKIFLDTKIVKYHKIRSPKIPPEYILLEETFAFIFKKTVHCIQMSRMKILGYLFAYDFLNVAMSTQSRLHFLCSHSP